METGCRSPKIILRAKYEIKRIISVKLQSDAISFLPVIEISHTGSSQASGGLYK